MKIQEKVVSVPKVSIILPVQNAAGTLPSCIESLLSQSYGHFEIIAIDDKSIDPSFTILKEYRKKDRRLKIYHNIKRYGLAITLNRALRKAKGKFIAFMDPKDTITKNKIAKQVSFLESNPKVVAVGTQCVYLNKELKRLGKSNFPSFHDEISQNPVHGVSVLFEGIMVDKYKIPKDLLYFPTQKNHFLYSEMAVKLVQYGQLANLPEYLQFHQTSNYDSYKEIATDFLRLIRFWISSRFANNANLSFKSFFHTALKSFV